jgi:serine/threonine protein kinase
LDSDNVVKAVFKKLGAEYKYVRHLGGGEFSNVYLVKHIATGKERALKILDYHYLLQRFKKQNLSDTKHRFNEVKRRFIGEARLYGKMHHPNIVRIHDTGVFVDPDEEIEVPYFIMSYVRGATLADVIKKKAPLDLTTVQQISRGVLGALEEMHRNNIVHRDIKASNIMIEEETNRAVIIDFGIAKDIVSGTKLTTTGALLGSPAYMAPELFQEQYKVGPALDIYSFGVVLYEMFTGETPFRGSNFIEVMNAHRQKPVPDASDRNPSLPPAANFIVAKAMAKDPGNRYKISGEFLDALLQIHDVKKPRQIHWFRYAGSAALIVLAVALFLVIKPFKPEPGKPADQPKKTGGQAVIQTLLATKPKTETVTVKQDPPDPMEQMNSNFEQLETALDSSIPANRKIRQCRQFLNAHKGITGPGEAMSMIARVKERKKQLEDEEDVRLSKEKYDTALTAFKQSLADEDFTPAGEMLAKAEKERAADQQEIQKLRRELEQKKLEYENRHGDSAYEQVKAAVTLTGYKNFKQTYPGSKHLEDLIQRLKTADRMLPPGSYWDKRIIKNAGGYYEFTFEDTHNGHRMIFIPGKRIWIDKYEVSNKQYRRFLKIKPSSSPAANGTKFIHSGDNYPAVVRYGDAEAYCKQYGFRLPRLEEWQYAAGKGGRIYPWGDDAPDGGGQWRANYDTLEASGEKDGFNGTAPVDSFKNFSSPFGALNMAGNVWEWVHGRILKGGGFFSSSDDLKIDKNRVGGNNDKEGFRCIKDETGE